MTSMDGAIGDRGKYYPKAEFKHQIGSNEWRKLMAILQTADRMEERVSLTSPEVTCAEIAT